MSAALFLDTNVLVYAFDGRAKAKQQRAWQIVHEDADGEWAISWQVVQEFSSLALRRFAVPMKPADLSSYLELVLLPRCAVMPTPRIYQQALEVHQLTQYAYYDSLLVASALAGGALKLYSEDLQDGRKIGSMTIVNPFAK